MLEVRALAQATAVLKQARDIRKGQPKAKVVLSMVGKNYRLTQDMKDAAARLRLVADRRGAMTLRQVYADAPGQGTVVWKMGARAQGTPPWKWSSLFRESFPKSLPRPAGPSGKRTGKPAAKAKGEGERWREGER